MDETGMKKRVNCLFNFDFSGQKELYEQLTALKTSMGITYVQAIMIIIMVHSNDQEQSELYQTIIKKYEKMREKMAAYHRLSEEYENLCRILEQKEEELHQFKVQQENSFCENEETEEVRNGNREEFDDEYN